MAVEIPMLASLGNQHESLPGHFDADCIISEEPDDRYRVRLKSGEVVTVGRIPVERCKAAACDYIILLEC